MHGGLLRKEDRILSIYWYGFLESYRIPPAGTATVSKFVNLPCLATLEPISHLFTPKHIYVIAAIENLARLRDTAVKSQK
jgi:hypothetical protein